MILTPPYSLGHWKIRKHSLSTTNIQGSHKLGWGIALTWSLRGAEAAFLPNHLASLIRFIGGLNVSRWGHQLSTLQGLGFQGHLISYSWFSVDMNDCAYYFDAYNRDDDLQCGDDASTLCICSIVIDLP